tara:strand:+ start:2148 stop:2801 length:654 start_codon:yes stop_codon:yes gene_type:complete
MKTLIFTKKIWDKTNIKKNNYHYKIYHKISTKFIEKEKPDRIFFIHWSNFIPKKIYKNYECIQFHCSDLPKFRGGSPIQNQIIRKIKKTKLTAFEVNEKIDSGPIYLKKKISLNGKAQEIYKRIEHLSFKMIEIINNKNIKPFKQFGKISSYKRRKPDDSFIPKKLKKINDLYDFIRMLDADSYPKAKINLKNFICELYDAKYYKKNLYGKFFIKKK